MHIARPTYFPVDTLYVALWGCQVGQTYNGALWVLRMAYISNFEVDISALDLRIQYILFVGPPTFQVCNFFGTTFLNTM